MPIEGSDLHFERLAAHAAGGRQFLEITDLPNIEDLLRPHDELVTLIEGPPEDVIARRQRVLWFALVVSALVWGCLTGLAIGVRDFFLAVPPALLGCGGIVVLAATLWTMARESK